MDPELLEDMKNFDFIKYFGVTMHTLKFDSSKWKTSSIIADLEEGIRAIKGSIGKKLAIGIIDNLADKTYYGYEHIKVFENSDKKVENIDKIVNDFKNKLIKVEKDLVFIEERYSYLRTDKLVALLNPINERELNDHRDILDRKIDTFLLNIKRFKKSKNLDYYYEVQNVYDKMIQTISDILKFISLLLSEPAPEFLNKLITEYLKSVPIKDEPEGKEETNCSKTKRKHSQEIYGESIDILTTEYLSAIKANRLQYQVRKLCKWGEEYHETIKSKDQKFEELQLKYDLLYEEHKN